MSYRRVARLALSIRRGPHAATRMPRACMVRALARLARVTQHAPCMREARARQRGAIV
jgi:hypothetical protein